MKIRDDVLTLTDDMGTSGTKQYDLDYADVIAGLELRITATTGATDCKNNPIERNVSKIEIVDGSDVLWSLPGDVAQALFAQQHGFPSEDYYSATGNDSPYVTIPIRFGRELYDPELAFDPRKFKNPQLKVTFDEATVTAAGATGYVSDSFTLTVVAKLVEDGPVPMGWLMAKDIYDFTSAGSGDEKVPMPTDYPWRLLIVRAYEAGTDLRSTISNYKLSCDGGKFVPFDEGSSQIVSRITEIFPPVIRGCVEMLDDGDTVQTWVGIDVGQAIHTSTASYIVGAAGFWPGQFTARVNDDAGTAASDITARWHVHGWCPHNTLLIPFGRLNEMSEWFQAPQYGKVELYLTQADADAEVNVCVQQLRTY